MAATNSSYCNFFVYTKYGFYAERINFVKTIWDEMVEKLSWFWFNYVGPNLVRGVVELTEQGNNNNIIAKSDIDFSFSTVTKTDNTKKNPAHKQSSETNYDNKKKREKNSHAAVYLCGICKIQLVTKPKNYDEESIGCDKCPLWFHLKCSGISAKGVPSLETKWYWKDCK